MARTKGATSIQPRQKVQIVAQKNSGLFPNKKIAESIGVTERAIRNIKAETVSPEVRAMAEVETEKLLAKIERARDTALDKLQAKLDSEPIPAQYLSTIFGTLYDKSRLESDKPTVIVQPPQTLEQKARELYRRAVEVLGYTEQEAFEGVKILYPEVDVKFLSENV